MTYWEKRPLLRNVGGIALLLAIWIPLGHYAELGALELGLGSRWVKAPWYIFLLLTIIAITRLYDRRPMAWAGIDLHRWTARELLQGAALGLGMTALVWLPFAVSGGVTAGSQPGSDFPFWIGYLLMSAAGEELLFRGYLFQRFVEITGPLVATILLSALFAGAHLGNPEMSMLSGVNIFLGGIFFALCYLRTGSLWLPFAVHFLWNFTLAKIFGLPVSGVSMGASLLETGNVLPLWIGGGAFGPEGGIAATAALVAGATALLAIRQITYSPYVYAERFWGARQRDHGASPSWRRSGCWKKEVN